MDPEEAAAFCNQIDSIDDLVDEINTDGSTEISGPADMAFVLERFASKFMEVAEAAPTDDLRDAFRAGHAMCEETARTLRELPPEAKVIEAAQISSEALTRVQELAPPVLEFRAKYCENTRET